MSRPNFTYRVARRNEWRAHNALYGGLLTWPEMNARIRDWPESAAVRFGPVRTRYIGARVRPSKYMPHIGAKQRSKAR